MVAFDINILIENLKNKTATVIGAGGLGGFVIEELSRLPLKEIRIVDGDVFSESNLDRQLFCNINNLGQFKAEEAAKRIKQVNKSVNVKTFIKFFNLKDLTALESADIIFDCTDNAAARLNLEAAAQNLNIPLAHGAIDGFLGQVSLVLPNDKTMTRLYSSNSCKKAGRTMAHIPAAVASFMVNEAVKHLTGTGSTLSGGKILAIDFFENNFEILKV